MSESKDMDILVMSKSKVGNQNYPICLTHNERFMKWYVW